MYIIHGHVGKITAIVGTSSARKAVSHLNRMVLAGLEAFITDDQGRHHNPRTLLAGHAPRPIEHLH